MSPEEAKRGAGREPAGLTRLFYQGDAPGQSGQTDFTSLEAPAQIDVPIYSRGLPYDVPTGSGRIEITECYACGSHDSSYCDCCGRCSHCCENKQCQYGCDFV